MTGEPAAYTLPGLWRPSEDEHSVARWESGRRQELVERFAAHVYGRTPGEGGLAGMVVRRRTLDPGVQAVRIEAELTLAGPRGSMVTSLLLHLPPDAGRARPVPAFVGLNFRGTHATTEHSGIEVCAAAQRIAAAHGEQAAPRGAEARRWPYRMICDRGYAVATMWYEELEVDLPGYASTGVRGLFKEGDGGGDAGSWGAIGAWAWGLSRALDALTAFPEIDGGAVIAVGHSRLGKAALWAAAQDQRFAGVVSNDSGKGGASLFRHRGIETIEVLASVRPHWFARRFDSYRNAEDRLPVDQHQLLALIAPRGLHVGSASRDRGADPRGEFLSTLHASPVFELYGHHGTLPPGSTAPGQDLAAEVACEVPSPSPGGRQGERLSYHLRDGEHDLLAEDWGHILDFAGSTLHRR